MPRTVNVPLGSIELRSESYDKHVKAAGGTDPAGAIKHRIEKYLELSADGGLLLPPESIAEIEAAIGKRVTNARDVVQAAAKSGSIEDGAWAFRFSIDPSYREPIEERAKEMGRTPKELIQDMVDYAIEQNWYMGIETEGTRRTFPPRIEKFLAERLGQDFTVEDIRKKFAELEKAAHAGAAK